MRHRSPHGTAPRHAYTDGPALLSHLPSPRPPSAQQLATERLPTRRAAALYYDRTPLLRLSLYACGPRTHTHTRNPQHPASCGLPRAPAVYGPLWHGGSCLGGISAEAEEEVDLGLTGAYEQGQPRRE